MATANIVRKGDPTEPTVSIQDEESVLRNLLTALSNLFVSFSGSGSGLIYNIKSGQNRFKTSRAINDGIDKSVQSVVIPVELCSGIDALFGMATGDPLRLVLRCGSLGAPWGYPGEDVISIMAVTTKVVSRTDFTKLVDGVHPVTTVPVKGDSIATVAWASESDIDLPVAGGVPGIMQALRQAVSEARQYVQYLPELSRSDEPSDEELAAIAKDLGR